MEPDAAEIRVLGCLIEKQRTTPDAYPLTLNSLRLACNQSTNRDPVVSFDDGEVRGALDRLIARKWATLASWSSGRTKKYKHLLPEAVGLSDAEVSLAAVLMLRGPQTPGELKQRTERLHHFASPAEIEEALRGLVRRELARGLPRQAGQREQRYEQLLGGGGEAEPAPAPQAEAPAANGGGDLDERVARVEEAIAQLREEITALRAELGG